MPVAGDRNLDFHFKAGAGVSGAQLTLVQTNGSFRDGQAQADAAAGPVTIGVHAVKGPEQHGECLGWNTGAEIPHRDDCLVVMPADDYADGAALWREADGIA